MAEAVNDKVLGLTADIVTAHIGHNRVPTDALPALIHSVYNTLSSVGVAEVTEELVPAVPIKKSVFPEYIVCLEDGAKMKMLKRYIQVRFGMTPSQYRQKWGLPRDYPMVAPEYSVRRSGLAKTAGLGRKVRVAEPVAVKAPARRAKG